MDNDQENIQTAALTLVAADEKNGFITYTRTCIDGMRDEGRYDAAHKLNTYLKKFVTYLGRNEIPFKDFDALLIRNYHTWLKNQELGQNTVSLYIRNLKRVYPLAVADGLTDECYPFQGVDVSYRVKKNRNRLTPQDVMQLRYMDVSGLRPSALFARDIFLFAIFTKGMTGKDIFYLTKDDIKDGRLTYISKVTCKEESVSWYPFLQKIVSKYAQHGTPTCFLSLRRKTRRSSGGRMTRPSTTSTGT